jgi:hypothetical protein
LIQFPYTTFHSGAQAGTEGKTTLRCKSGGSRVAAATQYQVPEIISHLALAPQSFAYFILFYFILFYFTLFHFLLLLVLNHFFFLARSCSIFIEKSKRQ